MLHRSVVSVDPGVSDTERPICRARPTGHDTDGFMPRDDTQRPASPALVGHKSVVAQHAIFYGETLQRAPVFSGLDKRQPYSCLPLEKRNPMHRTGEGIAGQTHAAQDVVDAAQGAFRRLPYAWQASRAWMIDE